MSDVLLHGNNVLSINGITPTIQGRDRLSAIFLGCANVASACFVEARRPNVDEVESVSLAHDLQPRLFNLQIDITVPEISFECFNDFGSQEMTQLFLSLWFDFEHVSIIFRTDLGLNKSIDSGLLNLRARTRWDELRRRYPGYILYKGVEEDVIWLRKSDDLMFPTFSFTTGKQRNTSKKGKT
jgi:hypothetical protein